MKTWKHIVLSMVILLTIASCRNQRDLVQEVPVETKEKIVERMVPVEVPADSSAIEALLECDSTNQVILKKLEEAKTKNMETAFTLDSGLFSYKAKVSRDTVYLPARDSIIEREVPVKVEVPVEVNKLTTWQKIWIKAGRVFAGVLVLLAFYLLYKMKTGGGIKTLLQWIKSKR